MLKRTDAVFNPPFASFFYVLSSYLDLNLQKGEIVSELLFDLLTPSFAMFSICLFFLILCRLDVLSFDLSRHEVTFPAETCWRSRLVILNGKCTVVCSGNCFLILRFFDSRP